MEVCPEAMKKEAQALLESLKITASSLEEAEPKVLEKKDEEMNFFGLVEAITAAIEGGKIDQTKEPAAIEKYQADLKEWKRYEFWDDKKCYTRNLIATDNETFALMLLCWNPGKFSPIHSHAGSECFLRTLQGAVSEVQYEWPEAGSSDEAKLKVKGETVVRVGDIAYMNDSLGLHKVGNATTEKAITLHCYMPPYFKCKIFPDCSTKCIEATSSFYSENGIKMHDC